LEKKYGEEGDKEKYAFYKKRQHVQKILLNSLYGVLGLPAFRFYDVDNAEAVTTTGQTVIKSTADMANIKYNKELGTTGEDFNIYIDTDSCYLSFEEVLTKSDWQGTEKEFIMSLYNTRLKVYLEKVLQKYAERYDTENFLSFEMESIARNAIWLAKKKYIQNIAWTDPDINFEDLTKIKTKGWETVQASTPTASRKILQDALKIIFSKESWTIDNIVKFLKDKKSQFKLESTEDICFNLRMNNYEKYVLDDVNQLELAKGAGPGVKSAGFYNYLLNNSQYKNKYQLLSSGERLKLYHTSDRRCEVFAYSAGEFPYEFAPDIDYETQFEKTVIDPLNRVLASMGMQTLNRNLLYAKSLF
jgi:hypothetical protein